MKGHKLTWAGGLVIVVVIVAILFMFGCKPATTTTTTTNTTKTTTTTNTTTSTTVAPKTLNIGCILWAGWPIGVDTLNGTQIMVDIVNAKGGLTVGNEKYLINLIVYDSQNNAEKAIAACNKLIYEDKVKYILCDGMPSVNPLLPITEANKVIFVCGTIETQILQPTIHYAFNAGFTFCQTAAFSGWLAHNLNYDKGIAIAMPDSQMGHANGDVTKKVLSDNGLTVYDEYYPSDSSDLSSLGTKVAQLNPSIFTAIAGGPALDSMAIKAVVESGWKGQLFNINAIPYTSLTAMVPPADLEGLITGAWPCEFDPPLTDTAKAFKDAFIAKFGKWESPEVQGVGSVCLLIAAIEKAGAVDVDAVANVISSGIQWESPCGTSLMVNRPDLGNERACDGIVAYNMKQIVNGQIKLLDSMTLDEVVQYYRNTYK